MQAGYFHPFCNKLLLSGGNPGRAHAKARSVQLAGEEPSCIRSWPRHTIAPTTVFPRLSATNSSVTTRCCDTRRFHPAGFLPTGRKRKPNSRSLFS